MQRLLWPAALPWVDSSSRADASGGKKAPFNLNYKSKEVLGSLAAAGVILPVRNLRVVVGVDGSGFSSCLRELVTLLPVRLPSLPDPISLPCAGADSLCFHPSPVPFDSREGLSSWSLSLTHTQRSRPLLALPRPSPAAAPRRERGCCGSQRLLRGTRGMLRTAEALGCCPAASG